MGDYSPLGHLGLLPGIGIEDPRGQEQAAAVYPAATNACVCPAPYIGNEKPKTCRPKSGVRTA